MNSVNGSGRPLIFFTNYGEIRDGRSVDDVRILKVKRLLLSPLKIRCLRKFKAVKRGVLLSDLQFLSVGDAVSPQSLQSDFP